ncbi:MAG: LamG-like jellyroll fold domain-containing protein [Lutibacter sp.]|uniref:LamG-like jellyroll fold domain-containing protein n=1 Tax=Lutibacter sp. TaxID=1925666 RepID=UPI00299D4BF4|nr:LamG-like jellyroll fold domain-containing protein [Lutibacter sp.]MDX1830132.1 LamG-like jellyroll fold domain-containing protein [Lutibacter sp.]
MYFKPHILRKILSTIFLFIFVNSYSQIIQVNILGGAQISQGETITINAGNSLTFRIINTVSGCKSLKVQDVNLDNQTNFSISPNNPKKNIKSYDCRNGHKYLDFTVTADNLSSGCGTYTTKVTVDSNLPDFYFYLTINTSPVIYVLGGNPWADILNGDTTTSHVNGTYFGVVNEGASVTRTYIIANIGNCPLDITSASSSNPDFVASSAYIPFSGLPPYYYITLDVTFTAPVGGTGTQTSTISIGNTDNTTFTFNVSAEMFNYNIPGPGGITAEFRLWLKSTRGISVNSGSKIDIWQDLGTNSKNAIQPDANKQPTYLDDVADNINFNPVLKFENDGASIEQYLYNSDNGFYSQDMYMVVVPDETITTSTGRRTIFSGSDSGNSGDLTGVGFGNYTSRFSNEVLTYAQDVESPSGSFYGIADTSGSQNYQNQGIINARNNSAGNGMQFLHNGNTLGITEVKDGSFSNVGYVDTGQGQPTILGTPYKIGKNFDSQGSLNGRVAEILTFAERVPNTDRPKIETYLAVKYGITLGVNGTSKDYINSAGTKIWDVAANTGFNYNIAGIAKDSVSDLNQKQSKSINNTNEVTIGLGGVYDTNSANSNEFELDKSALMWGCNNGNFTGTSTNTVTIATGLTSTLTHIDRKWKIIETGGEIDNVYIAIPTTAFSSFSKSSTQEYALIVSDNSSFSDADIIDVIPLKIKLDVYGNPVLDKEGNQLYTTWYDFDATKYFTFGKVDQLSGNRAVNISSGDYLVGESDLNLNVDAFTISAWIKSSPNTSLRTIMAKGAKLQLRLNSSNKVEVLVDNTSPTFTSNMAISDNKWHQITFVYNSGTIFLYVDGILDSSIQNIVHPSPNYNSFSVGALYLDKNNIINPFLGDVDEVYVWDFALSENQVRYLMNQEIEKVTGDFVSGKIIPYTASSNELTSIPWSTLRAYYDFNSFYGSTVEGKTNLRNFLRVNYLKKDKTIVENQTAPLPYISQADGAWNTSGTWLNNSTQMLPNSVGLDGTTSIDWNIVKTTHNISSGNRDINVLALLLNGGKLTLDGTLDLATGTGTGQGLNISHYLDLDGVIDLQGESQLVQEEGSVLDPNSNSYIIKAQQGTATSYNYNYWTSSVGPIGGTNNGSFTVQGVLFDGTTGTPQTINFSSSYNAADGSVTSPITLSTYWMYTFNGTSNDYYSWNKINESTPISPAEGYTMKGTSSSAAITDNQNYIFKGKPYNGDITLHINAGEDRLIGNPYPSAIDADEFILDNIKTSETINGEVGRNTVNVFNGALYFWHHFAGQTHYLSGYEGGYATYTLMGGAKAYANDTRINATGSHGNKIPERYIPVNQGFFVTATNDTLVNSISNPIEGGDILFKNSQRVFVPEGATGTNDGSVFFKSNSKKVAQKSNIKSDNRPKIRLEFSSSSGYHRQLLVGVDKHATKNFDLGYDAPMADLNDDDMFWEIKGSKFVIQAINNFDDSQELPLGLKTAQDGLISIKIDSLENTDNNLKLYIKDSLTGETYKINKKPFEINLVAGDYNNRFSIVFQPRLKTPDETILEEGFNVSTSTGNEIVLNKTIDTQILSIYIYNALGQLLLVRTDNLEERDVIIPLNTRGTGVYFVKINTSNGIINKKIVLG